MNQHRQWLPAHELIDLKGKVLGCWCSPETCHGDTLSRLADSILTPEDLEAWWEEEKKKIKLLPNLSAFKSANVFANFPNKPVFANSEYSPLELSELPESTLTTEDLQVLYKFQSKYSVRQCIKAT